MVANTDLTGHLLREIKLSNPGGGEGEILIRADEFFPGVYPYSLVVDGRIVATRQMV